MYDEGKEFTGGPFQDGLEMHGIRPVEMNRRAPFELGAVERRGGMFKEAYYRTCEPQQLRTIEDVGALIWTGSNSVRQAARKALMGLDAKSRLSRAKLGRPVAHDKNYKDVILRKFEPVTVLGVRSEDWAVLCEFAARPRLGLSTW